MKKHLLMVAVALLAIAIVAPAFAAVEFKYGGQFRWRLESEDNVFDGTDHKGYFNNFETPTPQTSYNSDDNRNFIDQRLRLYFTFIGSPNLKVVTKFEMGDATWGDPGFAAQKVGFRGGQNGGGNVGADDVSIEIKNAYIEFNIPCTPTTAIFGVQSLVLLDSWIIDDDFAAAVFVTKLDPFRVTVGYVGGQYGAERNLNTTSAAGVGAAASSKTFMAFTDQDFNVDDGFIAIDYTCAPFKASLVGFWQAAHKSNVSMDPTTLSTPVSSFTGATNTGFGPNINALGPLNSIDDNNLFDLGFNLTYKCDWLLAYVNFVKNFGSVDFNTGSPVDDVRTVINQKGIFTGPLTRIDSADYTGFMIDAGVTYFCGPWTFNVGGFYTTGPSFANTPAPTVISHPDGTVTIIPNPAGNTTGIGSGTNLGSLLPFRGTTSTDIEWFTYPLATSKYFSEIIGGGVLGDDIYAYRGYANGVSAANVGQAAGLGNGPGGTVYWRGYGFPTNLWTVTAGASYQLCPTTKLSGSYWYFGTAESVPVAFTNSTGQRFKMSDAIGHELDFYVDQTIVDGLVLTLVGAYLIADDAFCPLPYATFGQLDASKYLKPAAENAYEVGARLQWNF